MANKQTQFVQAGYQLTISTDGFSSGHYYVVGNPGEASGPLSTVSPSSTYVIEPTNTNRTFAIVSERGNIAYQVDFEYVQEDGANSLSGLTDVVLTSPLPDDVLVYNGTIWQNQFSVPGGGATELNGLTDVNMTTLAANQSLMYTGVYWQNRLLVESDISDFGSYLENINSESIDDLLDVTIVAPNDGEALVYNAGVWSNESIAFSLASFTTSDLAEGTNLYYTASRFNTAFGAKSTTDLSEGTNLYYTQARFDTAFAAKSTTDLPEGTNLYFTDERVDDRVSDLIQDGTGISWAYDDILNTLTPTVTAPRVVTSAKSADYTTVLGDHNKCFIVTGAGPYIFTLVDPSTGGDGYEIKIVNDTSSYIIIIPDSGLIDTNNFTRLNSGNRCEIIGNNSNYFTLASIAPVVSLGGLTNVDTSSVENTNILEYNNISSLWENAAQLYISSGKISSQWYLGGGVYSGSVSGTPLAHLTSTGTIYYTPFYVPRITTYTDIGIMIGATASTNINMCIYNDSGNGKPTGSPITYSTTGSKATVANTATTHTFSTAITLTPGLYWLASTVSANTTISGYPSKEMGGFGLGIGASITVTTLANSICGWSESFTYSVTMPTVGASLTASTVLGAGDFFICLKG